LNKGLKSSNDILVAYRTDHLYTIERLDLKSLLPVVEVLSDSMNHHSSFVYVCGNGGSATLSQHFAIDLGLGTHRIKKRGCKVLDLTSNAAVLTATANDTGYENVFASQIELYGKKGDVLIAVSSSGNSKNVVNAVLKAKELGVKTVGLTGFDGGELKKLVDLGIHVETKIGNYGTVEDAHSFVLHALTHLLRCREIED
jgi:D-sedoheptulose 7-phosphate isomerase